VDGGVALVTDAQPPEVVQVCETALDDPALPAEPRAVPSPAAADDRCDAAGPQQAAVSVVVVSAISQQAIGLLAGPAPFARHGPGMQVVEQRDQLGDVVAVAGGERDGKRDARRVDQQMMLGAQTGAIDRGWPGQEPPKSARIWEPSTLARDQSIAPAALSFLRSCW